MADYPLTIQVGTSHITFFNEEAQVAWDYLLDQGFGHNLEVLDEATSRRAWVRLTKGRVDGRRDDDITAGDLRWSRGTIFRAGGDGERREDMRIWVRQGQTENLFRDIQQELDGRSFDGRSFMYTAPWAIGYWNETLGYRLQQPIIGPAPWSHLAQQLTRRYPLVPQALLEDPRVLSWRHLSAGEVEDLKAEVQGLTDAVTAALGEYPRK